MKVKGNRGEGREEERKKEIVGLKNVNKHCWFTRSLLYTRHCARHLICTISFNITVVTIFIAKNSRKVFSSFKKVRASLYNHRKRYIVYTYWMNEEDGHRLKKKGKGRWKACLTFFSIKNVQKDFFCNVLLTRHAHKCISFNPSLWPGCKFGVRDK